MQKVHTITFSKNGGIQSICTAKKGDSQICIIGHARCEKFEVGPYSNADDDAKSWLLPFLLSWHSGDTPVALLTFDSEEMTQKHTNIYERNQNQEETFHLPLHAVINIIATQKEFSDGNLEIICTPCIGDRDQAPWDPTLYFQQERFPNFAQQAQFVFQESQQLETLIANHEEILQKRFYSKEGGLARFIKIIKKKEHAHLYTVAQYFELLEKLRQEAQELAKNVDEPCKSLAKKVAHMLTLRKADVPSYLEAYGIQDPQLTLLECLAQVMGCKYSFTLSCNEFRYEIVAPLTRYSILLAQMATLKAAKARKNLVILQRFNQIAPLLEVLKKAGYSVSQNGFIPPAQEAASFVAPLQCPFPQEQVSVFLGNLFGNTPKESLLAIKESPFNQFLAAQVDESSFGAIVNAVASEVQKNHKKAAPQIQASQEKNKDTAFLTCLSCKQEGGYHDMHITINKDHGYCSVTCLVEGFLKEVAPELHKILAKPTLAKKDQPLLQRIAALCFLRGKTLSPDCTHHDGSLYSLPYGSYADLLAEIGNHDTWKKPLALASQLSIDCAQLQSFFMVTKRLQETYRKDRLKHSTLKCQKRGRNKKKQKNRKEEQENVAPIFDEKNLICALLIRQFDTLRTVFKAKTASGILLARAYYYLMKKIAERVDFKPEDIESLLAAPTKKEPKKASHSSKKAHSRK